MIRVINDYYERLTRDDDRIPLTAKLIPTVNDLDEFCNTLHKDIIKQVMSGQGYYYGYECERSTDNEIPAPSCYLISNEAKKIHAKKHKEKQSNPEYLLIKILGFELAEPILKRLK